MIDSPLRFWVWVNKPPLPTLPSWRLCIFVFQSDDTGVSSRVKIWTYNSGRKSSVSFFHVAFNASRREYRRPSDRRFNTDKSQVHEVVLFAHDSVSRSSFPYSRIMKRLKIFFTGFYSFQHVSRDAVARCPSVCDGVCSFGVCSDDKKK